VNKAREGDFLETVEGLIFDVKGVCHPPDRVISFVRYIPDVEGERKRDGRSYRKVYELGERFRVLREWFPQYVYFDPIFHRELQGVCHEDIGKVYCPEERLKEILENPRDETEENVASLVEVLGIPVERMGVSGSILVGLNMVGSDLDIMVYGEEWCREAYAVLKGLREDGVLHPFDMEGAREKALFRWGSDDETLVELERKKVMHGLFEGREYFFRFLKVEEVPYGDIVYRPVHKASITAEITDDSESIFTPCGYGVSDCSVTGVTRLVSVRGRFCEQASRGDIVAARGTVEKVEGKEGVFLQLVMQDRDDFLIPQ
jgi:predicted nucleotidyltransferase